MIIGEFNDSFPPLMDGVGGVVLNYMNNLQTLGDTVYVVTGGYEGSQGYDEKMGWKNVFRLPGRSLERIKPYGILKTPPDLYDRLMAIDFDIIHIHSPFYTGSIGRKVALAKHIPLVGTFHTLFRDDINMFDNNIKPITEMVIKYIMRNYVICDSVWTPSAATKRILIEQYNFHREIEVMENGCDMQVPNSEELKAMREKAYAYTHIEPGTPVFLMVAQHKDSKNFPLVLESVKLLHQKGVKFQMLFVGDGPHREKYEAYVKENQLESVVSFLGMIKDRSLVSALYSITTLFTFPSLYDTSCLVMREAACYHVPVVFVRGACTSEDITDGDNGYLSEATPEAFSATMQRAIDKQAEHDHIGQRAFETLYHTWGEVLVNVHKRYQELIDR